MAGCGGNRFSILECVRLNWAVLPALDSYFDFSPSAEALGEAGSRLRGLPVSRVGGKQERWDLTGGGLLVVSGNGFLPGLLFDRLAVFE